MAKRRRLVNTMDTNPAVPSAATPIALTDLDRRIWTEEIDPVMPERIFDIHTHVYLNEHIGPDSPERQTTPFQLYLSAGWDDLDAADERVRAAGFEPHSHADYEPGRRFYFHDADGIEWEVVSYA